MRVFVTGASGHIGLPVVRDLLAAGHTVVGLARSEASANSILAAGAEVRHGTLDDLDGLKEAARQADGVIHLAFKHDLALVSGDFMGAVNADLRAVEAIGEALAGSQKAVREHDRYDAPRAQRPGPRGHGGRPRTSGWQPARRFRKSVARVRPARRADTSIVRLSPTVHSSLDHHGFIPMLIAAARKNGFAAYVAEGSARWPAVHTLDAARLYRLALEAAPAGSRVHAAAEAGVPFRAIAEAIARGLGVPAKSISVDEAAAVFGGFLGMITQLDNLTSSARTRELLGWKPTHAELLADIADGHYFASPNAE